MSRTLAVLLCVSCACACAKSPDASAPPKGTASAEANALTTPDAGAGLEAGGPVPGLPMPQHYPRFAWDAAAADAATR